MRGRPKRARNDEAQAAEKALQQWLEGERPASPETWEAKRTVRGALGDTEYAVDELAEGP